MHVYQAEFYLPFEKNLDLGLYEKPADAKAACQYDHDSSYDPEVLAWQNVGAGTYRAVSRLRDSSYYVTRRTVLKEFKPPRKR